MATGLCSTYSKLSIDLSSGGIRTTWSLLYEAQMLWIDVIKIQPKDLRVRQAKSTHINSLRGNWFDFRIMPNIFWSVIQKKLMNELQTIQLRVTMNSSMKMLYSLSIYHCACIAQHSKTCSKKLTVEITVAAKAVYSLKSLYGKTPLFSIGAARLL